MKYIKNLTVTQFVLFTVVGGLGTITNLFIFFIFADILKFDEILIAIIAFMVAVTQNYILNHKWTFKSITKSTKLSVQAYFKFVLSSLAGLGVNLLVLHYITSHYNLPFKVIAQGIGIFCGMFVNFILSKIFVFK